MATETWSARADAPPAESAAQFARLLPPLAKRSLAEHLEWYGEMPAGNAALIGEVERSGLRGKGGARFPTATKLAAVASRAPADRGGQRDRRRAGEHQGHRAHELRAPSRARRCAARSRDRRRHRSDPLRQAGLGRPADSRAGNRRTSGVRIRHGADPCRRRAEPLRIRRRDRDRELAQRRRREARRSCRRDRSKRASPGGRRSCRTSRRSPTWP